MSQKVGCVFVEVVVVAARLLAWSLLACAILQFVKFTQLYDQKIVHTHTQAHTQIAQRKYEAKATQVEGRGLARSPDPVPDPATREPSAK